MTAGWQKGDLVIIAARPSMGKTAFVLTAARNAAMHPDENLRTPVAIFSLDDVQPIFGFNGSLPWKLVFVQTKLEKER
ncbi:MAG: hypothetical protein BalsKO_13670 [Balneolaceae bacterium]